MMSFFKKTKGFLSNLSSAFAPGVVSAGYCKRCDRETRWVAHFAKGYVRCIECGDAPGHTH